MANENDKAMKRLFNAINANDVEAIKQAATKIGEDHDIYIDRGVDIECSMLDDMLWVSFVLHIGQSMPDDVLYENVLNMLSSIRSAASSLAKRKCRFRALYVTRLDMESEFVTEQLSDNTCFIDDC